MAIDQSDCCIFLQGTLNNYIQLCDIICDVNGSFPGPWAKDFPLTFRISKIEIPFNVRFSFCFFHRCLERETQPKINIQFHAKMCVLLFLFSCPLSGMTFSGDRRKGDEHKGIVLSKFEIFSSESAAVENHIYNVIFCGRL